jgi:hypothetical protein
MRRRKARRMAAVQAQKPEKAARLEGVVHGPDRAWERVAHENIVGTFASVSTIYTVLQSVCPWA